MTRRLLLIDNVAFRIPPAAPVAPWRIVLAIVLCPFAAAALAAGLSVYPIILEALCK